MFVKIILCGIDVGVVSCMEAALAGIYSGLWFYFYSSKVYKYVTLDVVVDKYLKEKDVNAKNEVDNNIGCMY